MKKELNKIMYVEDDADIQTIAQIAIADVGGYTLKVCSSGAEAIESAESYAPDLILLDVMMPGMDGPATLAELRKLPTIAEVPVIFITAKVQPEEVAGYLALGAIEVITKPFDPMTLAAQLTNIWTKANS